MKNIDILFDRIFRYLEVNLPESCYYHTVEHTQYVIAKARILCQKENLALPEILLIETAALYHDVGYVEGPKGHERRSCERARADLPEFGFLPDQIDAICGMIMATEIPQTSKTKYEAILADADLYYLAGPHFKYFGDKLFEEFRHADQSITSERWRQIQIDFISQHRYFTDYGREFLEPLKQENLKSIL